jgi:SpoIID/LytB domain protein
MIRRRTPSAACASVASVAVLVGGIVVSIGTSAHAEGAATVPPSRTMPVRGHGWGHGHGLSQEGANGAASVRKLSATQITSFYYPHTTAGSIGNPTMRIKLSSVPDNSVVVGWPTGSGAALTIRDYGSTNYQGTLPAATKWRFTAGTSGIYVAKYTSSGWVAYAPGGHASLPGPLSISYNTQASAAAPIRILADNGTETDYRGSLRLIRYASGSMATLSMERMEDYLLGVVPRESPSSWPAAALQSQAIAARSYAGYERDHSTGRDYDICDSTSCQVFGGSRTVSSSGTVTNLEPASSSDAVRKTAGVVRLSGGKAIFAQYSASNGGWSTDGGAAYLVAQSDPYDGLTNSSSHSWSATLPASALESRYPSIGTLRSVRVTQRDGHGEWGGRVLQAVLAGSSGSVTVSGSDIYHAYSWPSHSAGLRHQWFDIASSSSGAAVADFDGNGTTDRSVYRPSNGYWYFQGQGFTRFGVSGDVPVPGDYDGNGRMDIAVYRPSTGQWIVKNKPVVTWGAAGDIPVPADYTGDGITDIAVFRPSAGAWYVRAPSRIVRWGLSNDVPVPGDYDGNGAADFAVWRPSNRHWYVYGQGTVSWGLANDIPVPGDYTGDGKTDFTVWRPSDGTWYVNGQEPTTWGLSSDIPVPGDYTGDGITDRVVWRPSNGAWYLRNTDPTVWGLSTDVPLPLPYAIYRAR